MYIHGEYYNCDNQKIEVRILTKQDKSMEFEIGAEQSPIKWSDNPVEITSQVNNTFDHLLTSQACIKLQTSRFIPELFCASCADVVVNILRDGVCLFAGFIEPLTYSQPYVDEWDDFELNCIDVITALEYSKYANVERNEDGYEARKANATQVSFYDLLCDGVVFMAQNLDIQAKENVKVYYDGSKAVDGQTDNRFTIFQDITINELLFFGDDVSETKTKKDVLRDILMYLDLHIMQQGFEFFIFSWHTIKKSGVWAWCDLRSGVKKIMSINEVSINQHNVVDADTNLSIEEVYNQIALTCNVKDVKVIVESPLEQNAIKSRFVNKQLYLTEYSHGGIGSSAFSNFCEMIVGKDITNKDAQKIDWYLQLKKHDRWQFPEVEKQEKRLTLSGKTVKQHEIANFVGSYFGACLVAFGSISYKLDKKDNSIINSVDMKNYLALAVNGNGETDVLKSAPTPTQLKNAIPYAIYKGSAAGGVLSPADQETTNYIVFSGTLTLNALTPTTGIPQDIINNPSNYTNKFVLKDDSPKAHYYTRLFYSADNPNENPIKQTEQNNGLLPISKFSQATYKYNYSATGEAIDTVLKMPVLCCMLVIGDKCLVEHNERGLPEDFSWVQYKPLEACATEDEYYQQCFYIGIDPKIGDNIVGQSHEIQNNISHTMGINTKGMAVPIKNKDALCGEVTFKILGPVNLLWDDVTRKHPTFFRHSRYTTNSVPLLSMVKNIMIEDFNVKIHSDNALTSNTEDNDLIYISQTEETFINKKDDITFNINSALTAQECEELKVSNSVNLSTPMNTKSHQPITQIYNTRQNLYAKPEQFYVDNYYNEYSKPRVIVTQTVRDDKAYKVEPFSLYAINTIGKTFFTQSISRNLTDATAEITIKEIEK